MQITLLVAKQIRAFPKSVQRRVIAHIKALALDPRPQDKVKKLKGAETLYRIRVGDYRVVYAVDDTARVVTVTRVQHRREVYE
ncbi:type II toxin-antitoxin system RelE/ParE family toxin [Candidatus Uhrbacteria bacterium]|nr:type II toxin-antitoxin system RelE/ParE family toxin [Candidatus Uhrbacteria bacterium]